MRGAIGRHPHSFGLLRMTFDVEATTTKFIFIHAFDPINSGNFSAVERGQALSVEPEMDKALRRFAAFSVKVQVRTPEDCTAEALVEKLQEFMQGMSDEVLTVENFKKAVEHHKKQHPEMLGDFERQRFMQHMEHLRGPNSEPLPEFMEDDGVPVADCMSVQRRRVKLFSPGDIVKVYSEKYQEWMLNGEVAEVVLKSSVRDGIQIRAGSTKIVYSAGRRFKWLSPSVLERYAQPSSRARPPQPLTGTLALENCTWFNPQ